MPVWTTNKIKDEQFISSVKLVVALIFFPIYYLIVTTICAFVFNAFWLFITIPILPFVGLFAFRYYIEARKVFARFRFYFKSLFKNKELMELKILHNYITQKLDNIS